MMWIYIYIYIAHMYFRASSTLWQKHLQLKINGCINQSSNADTNIDARKDMSKLRNQIR